MTPHCRILTCTVPHSRHLVSGIAWVRRLKHQPRILANEPDSRWHVSWQATAMMKTLSLVIFPARTFQFSLGQVGSITRVCHGLGRFWEGLTPGSSYNKAAMPGAIHMLS